MKCRKKNRKEENNNKTECVEKMEVQMKAPTPELIQGKFPGVSCTTALQIRTNQPFLHLDFAHFCLIPASLNHYYLSCSIFHRRQFSFYGHDKWFWNNKRDEKTVVSWGPEHSLWLRLFIHPPQGGTWTSTTITVWDTEFCYRNNLSTLPLQHAYLTFTQHTQLILFIQRI